MKRVIFFVLITSIAFSACNKDSRNTELTPQESVLDYYPLSIGNYWVYERFLCDSTWTNCGSVGIDTNYVSQDTIINGLLYFKIEGRKLINNNPV